jgi:hypothetical protein
MKCSLDPLSGASSQRTPISMAATSPGPFVAPNIMRLPAQQPVAAASLPFCVSTLPRLGAESAEPPSALISLQRALEDSIE